MLARRTHDMLLPRTYFVLWSMEGSDQLCRPSRRSRAARRAALRSCPASSCTTTGRGRRCGLLDRRPNFLPGDRPAEDGVDEDEGVAPGEYIYINFELVLIDILVLFAPK